MKNSLSLVGFGPLVELEGEVAVRADPLAERRVHNLFKLGTYKTVKAHIRQSNGT